MSPDNEIKSEILELDDLGPTDREVLNLVLGMAQSAMALPRNPSAIDQARVTLQLISQAIQQHLEVGR